MLASRKKSKKTVKVISQVEMLRVLKNLPDDLKPTALAIMRLLTRSNYVVIESKARQIANTQDLFDDLRERLAELEGKPFKRKPETKKQVVDNVSAQALSS